MASRAPITGAPTCAPSNVIPLPTAATRKVRQHQNRATRVAKAALPRHPAEHLYAGQRAALRRVERLNAITRTPALVIACALYAALDPDARWKLMLSLAPGAAAGNAVCRDAIEMLSASTMTFGEQVDADWAQDRLAGKN